jgi:hypothetical protein
MVNDVPEVPGGERRATEGRVAEGGVTSSINDSESSGSKTMGSKTSKVSTSSDDMITDCVKEKEKLLSPKSLVIPERDQMCGDKRTSTATSVG